MAGSIIVVTYTAVLLAAGLLYLMKRYHVDRTRLRAVAAAHLRVSVSAVMTICALVAIECVCLARHGAERTPFLTRWAALIVGLLVVAVTDCREKRIPNKVLLAMLCIRICHLCIEGALLPEYIRHVILYSVLGGLISGWVILAARLLSRKGAGMGDVKMFAVLGLYVGSSEILSTLFWSFLVSALVGVFLLLSKRARAQDSLPMAPFTLAGTLIKFAFLALGG